MTKNKAKGSDGTISLVWSHDLTIRRITELSEEARSALKGAQRLEISFGEVEEVDISLLQLLCSIHRSAVSLGKEFAIIGNFPAAVQQALRLAGFNRHAGCSYDNLDDCLWKSIHENSLVRA